MSYSLQRMVTFIFVIFLIVLGFGKMLDEFEREF
jgi:hypothetical protein